MCVHTHIYTGLPGGSVLKILPAIQEMWARALIWEESLEKKWQPTLVFLTGKSHGQRSLAVYCP